MATASTTKNISVCKNRDYSKKFEWTTDLNNDVYNFYLEAKRDPSKGYTNRLKRLWDEKHPTFNHLTAKHLRQQTSRVEARRRADQSANPAQTVANVNMPDETNEERNCELQETPPTNEVNTETVDDAQI